MEDNIRIDKEEYTKQFREDTFNSDQYARVEILIPTANDVGELTKTYPLCNVDCHNSNRWTLALMAKSLEDTAQYILDKYDARDAYDTLSLIIKGSTKLDVSKEEEDNEK